jgi:hypothetical protein
MPHVNQMHNGSHHLPIESHHIPNGSHHMPNGSHHTMMFPNVLRTVQDCEATCEHMISLLLGYQDVHARALQIQFLRDCAQICATTAAYLARHSPLTTSIANLCAYICEVCGNECKKFPDAESQRCSRVCLNCAQECRAVAMAS